MKFNVGDKARVLRAACGAPDFTIGNVYEVAEISGPGDNGVGLRVPGATGRNGLWWWHHASDLELVADHQKVACILTEKVLVGDVPCRKILGFDGVLGREELSKRYLDGEPSFYIDADSRGAHVFDGENMDWNGMARGVAIRMTLPSGQRIDVGSYGFAGVQVGSVWTEATFQSILIWLKRAGSRLAKIRQQERAAWSGKETVEI